MAQGVGLRREPLESLGHLVANAAVDLGMDVVGFDPALSQRSDEGEHTARFKFILDTSDPRVERRVIDRVRKKLVEVPDLETLSRTLSRIERLPNVISVRRDA